MPTTPLLTEVLTGYQSYLRRQPLSEHTRRNYLARVKGYLMWLEGSEGEHGAKKALESTTERDFAVRDYKTFLLQGGRTGSTVNAVLAALDNFYIHLGMAKGAKVRRQDLPAQAPRALTSEEQRRLLKAVMHCHNARNQALVLLMLHCGLRISELAGLNVGDIFVTSRKGEVLVRCGKGQKQRRIPLNQDMREVMLVYLSSGGSGQRAIDEPLFLSQKGNRLSVSAIDHLVRLLARDAGVEMSAHSLRHTALTRLIRSGADIVLVAELAGHSRLETTRRYSLPTAHDKLLAMEKLSYLQPHPASNATITTKTSL